MSACTFLASNSPLPVFAAPQEDPPETNMGDSTICGRRRDDNFFLNAFLYVEDYTDKKHGVSLEWEYTDSRAKRLIEYIQAALQKTDAIELWHVWLTDYYEFEDRPFLHEKTISVSALTPLQIKAVDAAEIWNTPDKRYPNRPSFYCLTITR